MGVQIDAHNLKLGNFHLSAYFEIQIISESFK